MNKACLALLFLLSASFSSSQQIPSFQKEEDVLLSETENKIRKDLFFRGQVADCILENNLLSRVTKKNFSTYAQAREYLIFWAEKNPHEAASFYLGARSGDPLVYKGEISYVITSGRLKSHFLELVENLKKAAGDSSLSQEELRLSGSRLFEGFITWGKGETGSASNSKPSGEKSVQLGFSGLKLNAQALIEEERKLKEAYDILVNEGGPALKDAKAAAAFRLFKLRYEEFLADAASLKGRTVISPGEASRVRNSISQVRRSGFYLFAMGMAAQLRLEALEAEPGPLRDRLLAIALELEKKSASFQNPDFPFNSIISVLSEVRDLFEKADAEFKIYRISGALIEEINYSGFSGWFDWLNFTLDRIFPASEYSRIVNALEYASSKLEEIKKAAADGSLEKLDLQDQSFLVQTRKLLDEKKRISKANARMQFLCFEIFWPFGLDFSGKSAAIRLNVSNFISFPGRS